MNRIYKYFILVIFIFMNHLMYSQYKIENSVFGNGNIMISDKGYNLALTTGQPLVGSIKNTSRIINSGYWYLIVPPLGHSADTLALQTLVTTNVSTDVSILNNGLSNVIIYELNITGTDSSMFSLGSSELPDTILVGGNRSSTIKFSPTASGEKIAYLVNIKQCNQQSGFDSIKRTGYFVNFCTITCTD